MNWTLEWQHNGSWTVVASGHSRLRACIVLALCTVTRPNEPHRLCWKPQAPPVNTMFYGTMEAV